MKIIVSADSTCDLSKEIIDKENISIVPLIINLGDESYFDGQTVSSNQVFDYVTKTGTLPKTAARGIFEYQEYFENLRKKCDAVIHVSISSSMSSSHSNALTASKECDNVFVIDSANLSTGSGLIVLKICDLVKEGRTPEEIVAMCEEIIPKVRASFVVDTCKYLYKGGRCSSVAAFAASLLKIKPSIEVKDGKMAVGKKYLGKINDVLKKYVAETFAKYPEFDKTRMFITYSSCDALNIDEIEEMAKKNGFEQIYRTTAGCTISSHCGPNTCGVLFISK